jgi:predicted RNase H-like HicB family nuclease
MRKHSRRIYSYTVFYEAAPEGGYVALVPTLPGCHTQGETLEETEENVKEAIQLYVESLVDHDEAIPREMKSFQSVVRVPA